MFNISNVVVSADSYNEVDVASEQDSEILEYYHEPALEENLVYRRYKLVQNN